MKVLEQDHEGELVNGEGLETVVAVEAGGPIIFDVEEHKANPGVLGHFVCFDATRLVS